MATTIGLRIHSLRKSKGITQEELAGLLHVGKSTISQYETGRRVPSDETKIVLAGIFNVSVDYLIFGEDFKKNN